MIQLKMSYMSKSNNYKPTNSSGTGNREPGKSKLETTKNTKNKNKKRRTRKSKETKEAKFRKQREKVTAQLKEIQENYKKLKKKKQQHKLHEDAEPWGDILTTSQDWPQANKENTIRVMGQNVNGLSYYNDYVEWEMALSYMDEFQVDVMCLGEPNLDMKKPEVMEQLYKRLRKIDTHAKLTKST